MEDPGPYTSILFLLSVLKPIDVPAIIGIVTLIILLIGSAMVSGSEVAYFSLTPNHIHDLKTKDNPINKLILTHLNQQKYLLATILISNNFINVGIVVLSTYITTVLFNFQEVELWVVMLIQVFAVTSLILVFGEIMPKMLATQQPEKFARRMARPLLLLYKIFYQFSALLVKSTSFIDRKFAKKTGNISRDELTEAIEIASEEATNEDEKQILKGIVKFGEIDVKEIMKSRVDVTAIESNTKFRQLFDTIIESGYSRIPVFDDSFDNIQGILYVKDLLPHLDKDNEFIWSELLRPAFFVPENKAINDLLKEFQERKIHMAIVVDEYGGTSGIVTLEDVLEEIVGEISDEFDNEDDALDYTKLDDDNYIFEGKTTLNDFCKLFKIDDRIFDEEKGESDTLAGLILESLGEIPTAGTEISIKSFVLRVESADSRRIIKVKVTLDNNFMKKIAD